MQCLRLLLVHHIILNLETLTPRKTLSFEKLTVTERTNLFAFLRPNFRISTPGLYPEPQENISRADNVFFEDPTLTLPYHNSLKVSYIYIYILLKI